LIQRIRIEIVENLNLYEFFNMIVPGLVRGGNLAT
jgi:hypothetical protein